ncbi:MAG: carbohydrate-binding family 9-like protein [Cyclobacteriaceae bacterium]
MLQDKPLIIRRTIDFEIDGKGDAPQWQQTSWEEIPRRTGEGKAYQTRAKILYSENGIYCLLSCEDDQLTATLEEDFADLYNEDVVEIFFWTDEAYPFYFEYELSPLNYELPLMVPNREGTFFGWLPWHYEGDRKTRHQTSVEGGKKTPMAKVKSWKAEFFIPYALLNPLGQVPPQKGTRWRANIYRIDYDQGSPSYYQWRPTSGNFHQYKEFGTFLFE